MYSKNIWEDLQEDKQKALLAFGEDYKVFLSAGKTERLCVKEALALAKSKGFKDLAQVKSLKAGDKVYLVNKDKSLSQLSL